MTRTNLYFVGIFAVLSLVEGIGEDHNPQPDYTIRCQSTKGPFVINMVRAWSPRGADRFKDLVEEGYFDDGVGMFRVVKGFLVQFGISNNVSRNAAWEVKSPIPDDTRVLSTFKRGYVSFAGSGPNSRTTQTFICYQDNNHLGNAPWETPFGWISGYDMEKVVDNFYSEYGDIPHFGGKCPDQGRYSHEGGEYVKKEFPNLDYITSCRVTPYNTLIQEKEEL
ncbi:hypothetical protein AAMO2058_000463500 [Amorphochlora amoebiformis]